MKAKPFKKFPLVQLNHFDSDKISDEEIDLSFKAILSRRRNGQYLNPEILAHLKYFRNTLNMSHKEASDDPFENPILYPAMLHKMIDENFSSGTDTICEDSQEFSSSSGGEDVDGLIDENEISLSQNPEDNQRRHGLGRM